ncbi:IQ calmodulin-binding motif protein [Teratosphaeria destructans]|uniref:IQ calmodulin-binding motif protein n=1 Tax=Teratosphaeria destructans TaxID=418781 RepID=A0A9W7W054_9PEZI|nr:IQ calmodulin-binding motif protein [Teratosphaeria destructans]
MAESSSRKRALSRKEYLDTLRAPSPDEARRIEKAQIEKERAILRKYHLTEEEAATKIQKAYRGHRQRRQLHGLTLDPSERWMEAMKELRYRTIVAPRHDDSPESPADHARANWRRIGGIVEHAAGGERSPVELDTPMSSILSKDSDAAGGMLMDLRYFLEMLDEKHRYGTNLQVYHEQWQRESTTQQFFQWLDHGDGRYIDLPGCSRSKLDRERVRYMSKEERRDYLVRVDCEGLLRWAKNDELITTSAEQYRDSIHGIVPKDSPEPAFAYADDLGPSPTSPSSLELEEAQGHQQLTSDKTPGIKKQHHYRVSPATILNHLLRASIRPGTWIYVADTVGRLYVGIKSSGAFQHASFLSGARISSAGSIGIEDGKLTYLSPLSGHYRPTTASFRVFITSLEQQGVDMHHLRRSGAYRILQGMETYGRTRRGLSNLLPFHARDDDHGRAETAKRERAQSAAALVNQHWEDEHEQRHGLTRILSGVHRHRKSISRSPEEGRK